ncbi:hypothetical protein [Microvirga sp. KLBC 81]|nr:hypothetical protein [Microvirga sp. KLBC 81]
MRVSEAMTRNIRIATPDQTIQVAARMMADVDASASRLRRAGVRPTKP